METADDIMQRMSKEGTMPISRNILRHTGSVFVSKEQARTNVVLEILHAERDYVKHLRDVVQVGGK